MRVISKFFLICALVLGVSSSVSADHLYEGEVFYGGWWLSGSRQGDIVLGDGNGFGLSLGSTERYCVTPGTSYSTMRRYIRSEPSGVSWFVDEICNDGYVRVCVYARDGRRGCSTYVDYGWIRFD